ncbi:chemotaxis-specific protein-glutamate methyltransferase CheB [Nitrospira sp. M1]
MANIRVLIIESSAVIRRLLADELSRDSKLDIVGKAATGDIGLAMIARDSPDVVSVGIDMSTMDGLAIVSEIRRRYTHLPIVLCSTLNQRAARETLEALSRGADDYVTIPFNIERDAFGRNRLRNELIFKMKYLCHRSIHDAPVDPRPATARDAFVSKRDVKMARVDIVAIGVSTGGPNALADVLSQFSQEFPVPIVIVQHMPPIFTQCLSERLSSKCVIPVQEGVSGMTLLPGQAWIAPGNHHMTVVSKGHHVELALNQHPPENSCRPSVDVLFRSVAHVFGNRTLAVILTGMGHDGLAGSTVIRAKHGHIIVQDEESCVVWGMPGAVAQAGLADKVLPLSQIAGEITRRVSVERTVSIMPPQATV